MIEMMCWMSPEGVAYRIMSNDKGKLFLATFDGVEGGTTKDPSQIHPQDFQEVLSLIIRQTNKLSNVREALRD